MFVGAKQCLSSPMKLNHSLTKVAELGNQPRCAFSGVGDAVTMEGLVSVRWSSTKDLPALEIAAELLGN
jgi:hypothetical protein